MQQHPPLNKDLIRIKGEKIRGENDNSNNIEEIEEINRNKNEESQIKQSDSIMNLRSE